MIKSVPRQPGVSKADTADSVPWDRFYSSLNNEEQRTDNMQAEYSHRDEIQCP